VALLFLVNLFQLTDIPDTIEATGGTKFRFNRGRKEKAMNVTETKGLTARDYQDALDVQSACNLSGVVHSFSRVISKLREEVNKLGPECEPSSPKGTDWVNSHPICRLYAEQIAFLTSKMDYFDASKECREKSKE
jgi:hypothetical protein